MNYWVAVGGQQYGPFPLADLQKMIAEGRVATTDLAWAEGMPNWVAVSEVLPRAAQTPAQLAETRPIQAQPGAAPSAQARMQQQAALQETIIQRPAQAPVQQAPVQQAPALAPQAPIHQTPVQQAPVQQAPVQQQPVQQVPVQARPIQQQPVPAPQQNPPYNPPPPQARAPQQAPPQGGYAPPQQAAPQGGYAPPPQQGGYGAAAAVPMGAPMGQPQGGYPPAGFPQANFDPATGRPLNPQQPMAAAPGAGPIPPSLHWALVFVLSMFTGGLFGIVWVFIQTGFIKKIDPKNSSRMLFLMVLVLDIVSVGLSMAGFIPGVARMGPMVAALSLPFSLGAAVCAILAVFKMRSSMLQHYNTVEPIQLKLSGVMTFFFNIFYFQHHFSRIAEWKKTGRLVPQK